MGQVLIYRAEHQNPRADRLTHVETENWGEALDFLDAAVRKMDDGDRIVVTKRWGQLSELDDDGGAAAGKGE